MASDDDTPEMTGGLGYDNDEFEFAEEDLFFKDLPPIVSDRQDSPQVRRTSTCVDATQANTQASQKQAKLQLTKADLKRKDVPLFDCIYCVENAKVVMEGVLKKSLVTKYLEKCREIAGNEQIPVVFSSRDVMTKYDPDIVQNYFSGSDRETPTLSIFELRANAKVIGAEFLQSSLWVSQQKLLPSKREKVMEHKYGEIPNSFKTKVAVPRVATDTKEKRNMLHKSY